MLKYLFSHIHIRGREREGGAIGRGVGENERLERGDVIETLGILEGGLNGGGGGVLQLGIMVIRRKMGEE